ncbi:hypothetical protein [Halorussus amylolyticus]|uniref:hypothetical protein n=1 Tax=Halorussus amylolyticus TaxID=1126242 RepID=UPI00104D26B5|nr:hypothetical protein [Halorussus amylolyticus]
MTSTRSRRTFLVGVATGVGTALAGCSGDTGLTSRFRTFPVGESLDAVADAYLLDDLAETTAQYAVDYPTAHKRSVIETLFESGSVTTDGLQFTGRAEFGTTTRVFPRFARRDGTIYQIVPTDRSETTATRWVFYLDLTDEEPDSSATVVSEPPSSLSETDRTIVEQAMERTAASRSSPLDADDSEFPYRGVQFHEGLDPSESDLIPNPPFDYVERNDNRFAALAERGTVTVTEYSFEARAVGTSAEELVSYLDEEVVDARFDREQLSAEATDVLDTATATESGRLYTEEGRLSDGLRTVADRLGMGEHMPSRSAASFDQSLCRYGGEWYEARLTIR